MLNMLRGAEGRKQLVRSHYAALVARAREPVFFSALGVPDTIDGRFDLMTLHAWLVLDRLKAAGLNELSQGLIDAIFIGFEEGLRDLGTGDMGMGRRMKSLANAFYGRLAAYTASSGEEAMAEALVRNLYRGAPERAGDADILARYVLGAREQLARCDMKEGIAQFGPPPQGVP